MKKKFKKGDIVEQYDTHWGKIYLLIISTKYDPNISKVDKKDIPWTYVVKCIKDSDKTDGGEPDYTGDILNWFIGNNGRPNQNGRRTWRKRDKEKVMVELL